MEEKDGRYLALEFGLEWWHCMIYGVYDYMMDGRHG